MERAVRCRGGPGVAGRHVVGRSAMRILARLPKREIEGADEVLEGFVGEFASGNQCRIWPAMTYDRESPPDPHRVLHGVAARGNARRHSRAFRLHGRTHGEAS
jgi:hypothetical protein